jgi:hypothetical protein
MKVVSFCLWGNKPIYNVGLIENVKLAKIYYPDWECWAYIHEKTVPKETVEELKKHSNVKIIFKTEERIRPRRYMLWRFEPADNPNVTHFISRDTDSRISPREVMAVEEWLDSGKTLHIMRDHPQHYPKILGGMFGAKCPEINIARSANLTWAEEVDLFYQYTNEDTDDQTFLHNALYGRFLNDCIIHDENKLYEGNLCNPFPIPYEQSGHFVGCYVSENNVVDHETSQILKWKQKTRISTSSKTYEELLKDISNVIKNIYIIGTNSSINKTLLSRFIPVSEYTTIGMDISLVIKEKVTMTPDLIMKLKTVLDNLPETWTTIYIDGCYLTNKRKCKISVIIPTFNRYEFLKNAIRSVNEQTYKNIELIVVNDGSTQCEYYSSKLRDLMPEKSMLIHMKTNSSALLLGREGRAAHSRNTGIKLATGEYIAFLDDDDYWLPEKLQKQLDEMERSGCKMSCSEGYIGSGPYDIASTYPKYMTEYHAEFLNKMSIKELPDIFDKKFLSRHNFCINSSVIIEKSIIDKIGFFPYKSVGEDYSYWLKAVEHTNCAFVKEPLMYYDMKHGNGSQY